MIIDIICSKCGEKDMIGNLLEVKNVQTKNVVFQKRIKTTAYCFTCKNEWEI